MSAIGRERRYPKSGMAEVAGLPRRQLLAVAVLMCVPVPLLTLGGLVVPFPELAQRALAPILPFVDSPGTPSASGAPASVRALPILADPADRSAGEDATANPVNDVRTRTSNADTVARTDPGGSPVRPAAADGASSPSAPAFERRAHGHDGAHLERRREHRRRRHHRDSDRHGACRTSAVAASCACSASRAIFAACRPATTSGTISAASDPSPACCAGGHRGSTRTG